MKTGKAVRRRLLTFLNTWVGLLALIVLVVGSIALSVWSLVYAPRALGATQSLRSAPISLYDYSDNIGGVNKEFELAYGPIDVVYTWVNGSDPIWLEKKEKWSQLHTQSLNSGNAPPVNETMFNSNSSEIHQSNATVEPVDESMSSNRYRDSNELKYSLRSIRMHAPWVRRIFIVTDNQVPSWLNLETDRLSIVTHEQIFPNKSHLPVFSSPAIEAHLHRIPGLSKKFIYFNDDVFLGKSVVPEDFVSVSGIQKFYLSWDVPKCNIGCSDSWIGDGYCDVACNVSSCNFDFPDCINGSNTQRSNTASGPTRIQAQCSTGCPDNWLADKVCDVRCKNQECGWDAGDCGVDKVVEAYPGLALSPRLVNISKGVVGVDVEVSLGVNNTLRPPAVVALTIPDGVRGAYFNTSFLACETLLDPSACDMSSPVPGFTYSVSEHVDGALVHLSVLLTKHHLLVVVMYNGQDGSPPRPEFPYDTELTVGGFNSLTNITVNATFAIRVINATSPVDIASMGFPPGTKAVTGYVGVCAKDRPPAKGQASNSLGAGSGAHVAHLPLRRVDLQARPFSLRFASEIEQTLIAEVNNPVADAYNTTVESNETSIEPPLTSTGSGSIVPAVSWQKVDGKQNGVVLELSLGTIEDVDASLLELSARLVRVQISVTFANQSFDWVAQLPFSEALGAPSEPSMLVKRGSTAPGASVGELLRSRLAVPTYTQIAEKYDQIKALKSSLASTSSPIQDENKMPIQVMLLVPFPYTWGSLTSKQWVHFKVELVVMTSDESINASSSSSVRWSRHPHTVKSSRGDPSIDRKQLLCVMGAVQYGGQVSGANSSASDSADMSGSSVFSLEDGYDDHVAPNTDADVYYSSEFMARHHHADDSILAATEEDLDMRRLLSSAQSDDLDRWRSHADVIFSRPTRKAAQSAEPVFDWHVAHKRHRALKERNKQHSQRQRHRRQDPNDLPASSSSSATAITKENKTTSWSAQLSLMVSNVFVFFGDMFNRSFQPQEEAAATARRRLEDTYAASLVNVNRMYTKAFGSENRKVPAHMPHMIDKYIVQEMQNKWVEEWNETSTHRFRSSKDMQYSFSYYYYAMNRNKAEPRDVSAFISEEVDSNKDGYIDANEFRTLVTLTMATQTTTAALEEQIVKVQTCVNDALNASASSSSGYSESRVAALKEGTVDFSVTDGPIEKITKSFVVKFRPSVQNVTACALVVDGIRANVDWSLYSPTFVLGAERDVAFEMIGDNFTNTLIQLDSVRGRRAKFICINDNMQNPTPELEQALEAFFESFFPIPSQFELPKGAANPTLYADEYYSLRPRRVIPSKAVPTSSYSNADLWPQRVFSDASDMVTDLWRGLLVESAAATRQAALVLEQAVRDSVQTGKSKASRAEEVGSLLSDLRRDVVRLPTIEEDRTLRFNVHALREQDRGGRVVSESFSLLILVVSLAGLSFMACLWSRTGRRYRNQQL